MYSDIIVPVDGSSLAETALDLSAEIAHHVDADLRVLAYTRHSDNHSIVAPVMKQVARIGRKYEHEPHLSISELNQFVADHVVAEANTKIDPLICMASHGRGRSAAYHGSVASELLNSTDRPVLLVGPRFDREHYHFADRGPIIVAVDGTVDSESIVRIAEEWSVMFDLPLEVVTVLEPENAKLKAAVAAGDVLESGYVSRTATAASQVMAEAANFDVLHDRHPANAILTEAKLRNASVVAMATHARTGIDLLREGSVTAEVVRYSPVPVLVVHCPPINAPS